MLQALFDYQAAIAGKSDCPYCTASFSNKVNIVIIHMFEVENSVCILDHKIGVLEGMFLVGWLQKKNINFRAKLGSWASFMMEKINR